MESANDFVLSIFEITHELSEDDLSLKNHIHFVLGERRDINGIHPDSKIPFKMSFDVVDTTSLEGTLERTVDEEVIVEEFHLEFA